MKKKWFLKIPVVITLAATGVFVFSGAFMLLWNSILPAVLHVGAITIWQAAGILLISKILFGGFKGRHRFAGGCREKTMHMKWRNMSAEDREKYGPRMYGYATCRATFTHENPVQ